jgi:serine/threonine protein phosphatase PrpC
LAPFETAIATHIGGRDENQDALWLGTDADSGQLLAVVADGMGGHSDGSVAARLAVDAARDVWERRRSEGPEELLQSLVAGAHKRIRAEAESRGIDSRTVLAALWIGPEGAISIHAGDCRVLQFGRSGLVKRTVDHSIAQINVLRGKLSEAEMVGHPDQARLTTSIGGVDSPDPEITCFDLTEGDRFLVCSDGFWALFEPLQQQALLEAPGLQEGLSDVLKKRLDAAPEDHDNTTAILVRAAERRPAAANWRRRIAGGLIVVALVLGVLAVRNLVSDGSRPPTGSNTSSDGATPSGDGTADSGETGMPSSEGPDATRPGSESPPDASQPGGEQGESDAQPDRTTGDPPSEGAGGNSAPGALNFPNVDIPVSDKSRLSDVLTNWLHEQGELPTSDGLGVDKIVRVEGGRRIERLVQMHEGLPVDDGEVVITVEGKVIVAVVGRVQGEIRLPEGQWMEYPEALVRAGKTAGISVQPDGRAELYVARRTDGSYTRAWRGMVVVSPGQEAEVWLIDAHTGQVLRRQPLVMEESGQ